MAMTVVHDMTPPRDMTPVRDMTVVHDMTVVRDMMVIHDLALSGHYGLPMLGRWDATGIVASLVLAVGGAAVGAWGFARRDLRG